MARARGLLLCSLVVFTIPIGACGTASKVEDMSAADIGQKPKSQRSLTRDEVVPPGPVDSDLIRGLTYTGTGSFTADPQQVGRAAKSSAAGDGENVTLNLVGVPIANAAKIVLGDLLKLNYTVAEKVVGNITIQTSTPMPRSAVVEVFEQALKLNGAVLVQGDGHYRIMPAGEGAAASARLTNNQRRERPGLQLQVVTLRHVTPSEIKRVIDPIAPQGMVVKIDDARNLLVLAGSARELGDAAELIGMFDVDWMRGMSIALHPVSSSDPEAIVKELEPIMGIDRDGPQKGALRVIPIRRLGAIMLITSRPHLLDRARVIIENLDKVAAATEEQLFVHKVLNRSASELATVLTRVLASRDTATGSVGGVAPRFDAATLTSEPGEGAPRAAATSSPPSGGTASPSAGARAPTSASPSSIAPGASTSSGAPPPFDVDAARPTTSAQPSAPRGPKIMPDEINHTLLITATRREYERIRRILERIDVMPTQVMLEAMIAEVTLTDQLKFGVKWHLESAGHSATLSDATSGAVASVFPGFSYFFATRSGAISAVLDALSTLTKVNIVSAPSLMVLDNRRATLQIGDQVPIVTQQAQAVTAGVVGPIINSVTLKDTGIILTVVPHVNENGKIILEIEQEVSSANKTQTSGIDSPTISQRRVRTSVVVQDGDVVTLGGMIQERDTESKSQVPILGNLPVVGSAFRQKDDKIERTELLIFIRPMVVANRKDAAEVTQELRQRLNLERPRTSVGRNIYDRDARRILH